MLITFEERVSDSTVVERVWRSSSERAGTFLSMASCHSVMVVTRVARRTFLTVLGPETRATVAECPAEGEWMVIHFKLGTFMPLLPAGVLRDRNDVTLPVVSGRSFWLNGAAWEYPAVEDTLRGEPLRLSPRPEQRRVLRATGLSHGAIRQIERARRAAALRRGGACIVDVAYDVGYVDQPHLTRSLKRFIGQTPAEIAHGEQQLSLSYNTAEH